MSEHYSTAQVIEVLQSSLYADDMLGATLPRIRGNHDEQLHVTLPNGQRFAFVAHEILDAHAVQTDRTGRTNRKVKPVYTTQVDEEAAL